MRTWRAPGSRPSRMGRSSHDPARHRAAQRVAAASGQRVCDGAAPGARGRDRTAIGNHTFRATGITAYLKNGGTLENATAMANHA
jgi:hypothetical protein